MYTYVGIYLYETYRITVKYKYSKPQTMATFQKKNTHNHLVFYKPIYEYICMYVQANKDVYVCTIEVLAYRQQTFTIRVNRA